VGAGGDVIKSIDGARITFRKAFRPILSEFWWTPEKEIYPWLYALIMRS